MVQLKKLKLENWLVIVGAFLGLLAMLMPMYYCMYNGEEIWDVNQGWVYPWRYHYKLVFMPDFYPFTILLHLLFIVLIIGSTMNNFVTSNFMKLCPLIFSIILILLFLLDGYVVRRRDYDRIILDYSAGFYFLLTSIGSLFIGGLMINLKPRILVPNIKTSDFDQGVNTKIFQSEKSENIIVANASDIKSENIIIPDTCPHCKSPNLKKNRICEWCGNQII